MCVCPIIEPHDGIILVDRASVGAEHCLVGCAAFSRLSGQRETNAIQISLLAVRKRCRKMGIGRHLMQVIR